VDATEDTMEGEEDNLSSNFQKRFGWYAVIERLAGDDITKHNQITATKLVEAFNHLVYLIAKDEEQKKEYEAMKRKNAQR